MVRLT